MQPVAAEAAVDDVVIVVASRPRCQAADIVLVGRAFQVGSELNGVRSTVFFSSPLRLIVAVCMLPGV